MWKLRMSRSLSAPLGVLSTGYLHPVGYVTQVWQVWAFSFMGNAAFSVSWLCFSDCCLPINTMGTHLYLSAVPGNWIHVCTKAFGSLVHVLSNDWSLWWLQEWGMDLVRFQKGREAHTILLEHQAPCQNRAALSSLSQLLLWMLILHFFLYLYI